MMVPGIIFNANLAQNQQPKKRSSLLKGFPFSSWVLLMILALGAPSMAEQLSTSQAAIKPQPTHIDVQEIKSKKGITAWFVAAHEIPVVSVAIAFKNAGNAADPKGLAGMAYLIASTIDEGAGDWDNQEFSRFLLKNNIELSISSSQDVFQISFRTIKKNINEAFHALKTILTKPRFDEASLARVKNQILSILGQSLHNEQTLAVHKLYSILYGDHPYGITVHQTLKEFSKITDVQMRQFMKERFGRDQLVVSAVGDITTEELKDYLDKAFGDFPEKANPSAVKEPTLPKKGTTTIEPLNIPQSLVCFAQPGIRRTDPDFYTAVLLTKIMGDGQFESRLWNEVREKRGLTYSIDAELSWSQHSSLLSGSTATTNKNVKEVIKLIRKVWADMGQGATQAELDFVKKRMIGSFALNFSSTLKIARALLVYQIDNLGIDYINKRNEFIAAVTLNDINRVAKSLLNPEQLTFVIVGDPKELSYKELTQEKEAGASKL